MNYTIKIKILLNCDGIEDVETKHSMSVCYFISQLNKVFDVKELKDISDSNEQYIIISTKKEITK